MSQQDVIDAFKTRDEQLTTRDIGERLGVGYRNSSLSSMITQCIRRKRLEVIDIIREKGKCGSRYLLGIHPECDLWRD